jgi:AraC-like DNA-binding protein
LGKNDVFLIDCAKAQEYGARGDWDFYWLHFGGKPARAFYQAVKERVGAVIKGNEEFLELWRNVYAVAKDDSGAADMEISLQIHALFAAFLRRRQTDARILDALAYMRAHIFEKIDFNALCALACMSRYHFARVFRAELGRSPYQYLLWARLNEGKRLLGFSDCSVTQIAEKTGFESPSNFIKRFKAAFGVTPGEYRKRIR